MSGVLGAPALIRQDIVIGRGRDQKIGFRWSTSGGSTTTPVDVTGHNGIVRLESVFGDVWSEFPAEKHTGGLVIVHVTPERTLPDVWGGRSTGKWSLTLIGPDGTVTVLAAGEVAIEQSGGLLDSTVLPPDTIDGGTPGDPYTLSFDGGVAGT